MRSGSLRVVWTGLLARLAQLATRLNGQWKTEVHVHLTTDLAVDTHLLDLVRVQADGDAQLAIKTCELRHDVLLVSVLLSVDRRVSGLHGGSIGATRSGPDAYPCAPTGRVTRSTSLSFPVPASRTGSP